MLMSADLLLLLLVSDAGDVKRPMPPVAPSGSWRLPLRHLHPGSPEYLHRGRPNILDTTKIERADPLLTEIMTQNDCQSIQDVTSGILSIGFKVQLVNYLFSTQLYGTV